MKGAGSIGRCSSDCPPSAVRLSVFLLGHATHPAVTTHRSLPLGAAFMGTGMQIARTVESGAYRRNVVGSLGRRLTRSTDALDVDHLHCRDAANACVVDVDLVVFIEHRKLRRREEESVVAAFAGIEECGFFFGGPGRDQRDAAPRRTCG